PQPLLDDLAKLRAERYVAHAAKDLKEYGLDPPALRVTLMTTEKPLGAEPKASVPDADKKDEKKEEKPPKERVLLIGKPTEKDAQTRYAKLGDGEAGVGISQKVGASVGLGPPHLLARKLLALDDQAITRVQRVAGNDKLTLQRENKEWRVTEGPSAPFAADAQAVRSLVTALANLQAQKFAAYGPKADLAKFGLDK